MTGLASLGNLLAHTFNAASQQSIELAKIKGSTIYIKAVKSIREVTLNLIGMSACLMLAATSLIIFHMIILLYAPFTLEVRIWITAIAALIYMSIALITFVRLFSERKWLKVFKGDEVLLDILEDKLR